MTFFFVSNKVRVCQGNERYAMDTMYSKSIDEFVESNSWQIDLTIKFLETMKNAIPMLLNTVYDAIDKLEDVK